ncbi:MAG: hypothetical protein M3326_01515 [Actinomycetota bacterium]|nr:hypothetical protein [Actinomycetota bacterium]
MTTAEPSRDDRRSETTEPRVTEKPVAQARRVAEYVVSVDQTTGAIMKIERLERDGSRKEFTEEEYVAAYTSLSYAAPYFASYAAALYDPLNDPAIQTYLKAVVDYWKALIRASSVARDRRVG